MELLDNRIKGIFDALDARYHAGTGMSSASKGNERELFVKEVLSQVFPTHFRFSDGDIIDTFKRKSGQVDIVLEKPVGYSFPQINDGPRIFLAENVAAVIEVKSNLQSQWKEVLDSSAKVAKLRRIYQSEFLNKISALATAGFGKFDESADKEKIIESLLKEAKKKENIGKPRIPYYVVGFKGWKKDETIIKKLLEERIDGILILESRKFFTKIGRSRGHEMSQGSQSLLGFLHLLEISFLEQPHRPPAFTQYLKSTPPK